MTFLQATPSVARWSAGVALLCALAPALAAMPEADALRARHASLAGNLAHNAFQRPIHR
jgi:hypothetical protein